MGDRDALLDTACDELQHFLRISAPRTEVVTSLGLTLHQFRALVIVYSQEGCTTTDLAEQVGVHPSVATGIVQRMVQRGVFERSEDPADRRIRRIRLTASGRELAEEVVGTARVQRREQLESLDDAQLELIATMLSAMIGGINGRRGRAD